MDNLVEVVLAGIQQTLIVTTTKAIVPDQDQKAAFKLGVDVIDPNGKITNYQGQYVLSVGTPSETNHEIVKLENMQNMPVVRLHREYTWRLAK